VKLIYFVREKLEEFDSYFMQKTCGSNNCEIMTKQTKVEKYEAQSEAAPIVT